MTALLNFTIIYIVCDDLEIPNVDVDFCLGNFVVCVFFGLVVFGMLRFLLALVWLEVCLGC